MTMDERTAAMEAARRIVTTARIRDVSPTYPMTHRAYAEQELRNLISAHGEAIAMALLASEPDPRVGALEGALLKLANAADDVGVRFFDTDTMDPLVEAMQSATLEARALLPPFPAFETVKEAHAAGVYSGMLANGDTFGDEDEGEEGGHSEFIASPPRDGE